MHYSVNNIRLTAVGDIMLGDHPVRMGNGVRSLLEKKGHEYLFEKCAHALEGSDVIFGNLEVVHSDVGLESGKLESVEFRGMPSSISYLKHLGFSALGVANNHCMEHGVEAFNDTIAQLYRNEVFPAGLKSETGSCIPYEVEINGTRLILLSYSLRAENYFKGDVPYALSTEASILDEVRRSAASADVLVVSLHWGEEYMEYPSPRQVRFAHRLVDAGVRLILGHHPHVLQGIERYRGAIIAYSLGNFVFDMWQKQTRKTLIFKAEFSREGVTLVETIPAFINQDYQPELLCGAALEKFQQYLLSLDDAIANRYGQTNIDAMPEDVLAEMQKDYLALARKKNARHRLEDYAYFLANIYKYPLWVLIQSFKRFCLRRITG